MLRLLHLPLLPLLLPLLPPLSVETDAFSVETDAASAASAFSPPPLRPISAMLPITTPALHRNGFQVSNFSASEPYLELPPQNIDSAILPPTLAQLPSVEDLDGVGPLTARIWEAKVHNIFLKLRHETTAVVGRSIHRCSNIGFSSGAPTHTNLCSARSP